MSLALAAELGRIIVPRWVRTRPSELTAYEADGLPGHASRPQKLPSTEPSLGTMIGTGNEFLGAGRPSGMRERQTIVSADVAWNDSGIDVRAGQTIYF